METSQPHLAGRAAPPPEVLRHEPLADLVSRVSQDIGLLMKQELGLAKQEVANKVVRVKAEATGMALGGTLLHAGVLLLATAVVLGLSELLAPWLAALIVAIVLLAVGGGLLMRGRARLAALELAPKIALENVQRDVDAVQEAVR